jgi:hypothetical protein
MNDLRGLMKSHKIVLTWMGAGIIFMAIFWSVPIALMAAEMGTSVPVCILPCMVFFLQVCEHFKHRNASVHISKRTFSA